MKRIATMVVIGIMLVACSSVIMPQTQSAWSNSEYKMAYTENNYDLMYSPIMHADIMTYNMLVPVFNLFNSHGIFVSQTYFLNKSRTMAYDSETLVEYPQLRAFAIAHQDMNGIYTHAMRMNTALTTSQTLASLNLWKSLMGSYPLLWIDHGGMPQNIDRYGSQPSSQYYIGGLRNSTSLKYAWVNYDDSLVVLPKPSGYDLNVRNSLKGFADGRFGLVYTNQGNTNLFTSGQRILYPEFYVPYDYFIKPIAAERGLALEHTYDHYYVYKTINGVKYTKSIPRPSAYTAWNTAWNLHYMDSTSPWTIMPEYVTALNDILAHYTVASGFGDKLIDRGVLYNGSSVYKSSNLLYISVTSTMKNVTIYSTTDQSGKALYRGGSYSVFTKGYNSWGATIPSCTDNHSYTITTWSKYYLDNGQIGRLVYNSDGTVDIHCKRSGTVTLQVDNTQNIVVSNITGGGTVGFTISGNLVTFQGAKNCHYIIGATQHQYVQVTLNVTDALHQAILLELQSQYGVGNYTNIQVTATKEIN